MKLVVVELAAYLELQESVEWYEQREPGVGTRFSEAALARLDRLQQARLRPLKLSAVREARFVEVGHPWPYRIIVLEWPNTLQVVSIAHHHRQTDHWRKR